MLFHITSTHTEDNCPGYDQKRLPGVREAIANRNEIAQRHNVKLHWFLSTAPDHTFYTLVEAERQTDVDLFIRALLPFPHDNALTPVITAEELEELARQLAQR
jgi:hypothetical protein